MAGPLDVRALFPGLRQEWARLDGAAGSQVLGRSAAAVADYLTGPFVANLHSPSRASRETDALLMQARTSVGRALGADDHEVVFGASMTTLTGQLASALEPTIQPGDEIVCTVMDHDANVAPWLGLAGRTDAIVRFAQVDGPSLDLSSDQVIAQLSDRTRVVAMTAASNVVGSVPDVTAVADATHERGALLFLDAVHAVPHGLCDIARMKADIVVCSAYKWFGPHVGVMAIRKNVAEALSPERVRPAPATGPEAWERGALPFELIAGIDAAAQFLVEQDWPSVREVEAGLLEHARHGLEGVNGLRLLGSPKRRTPTLAFTMSGFTPTEIAAALADRGVAVGHGNFYAVELMRILDIEECVRLSIMLYNQVADVDRALDALSELAKARA